MWSSTAGGDNNRKMKDNGFYNAIQSCMAVPHADFLFTEKSFKHLLMSEPMEQLRSYQAVIGWGLGKIIKLLEGVEGGIRV